MTAPLTFTGLQQISAMLNRVNVQETDYVMIVSGVEMADRVMDGIWLSHANRGYFADEPMASQMRRRNDRYYSLIRQIERPALPLP